MAGKNKADRDGMVAAGMERGVTESHERLDQLLEEKFSSVVA